MQNTEFFEKACSIREEILKSNSPIKEIELNVLSKIVEQVFFVGHIPNHFVFAPYPRHSHTEFFTAVDNVMKLLNLSYVKSKQMISSYTTKNSYQYTMISSADEAKTKK